LDRAFNEVYLHVTGQINIARQKPFPGAVPRQPWCSPGQRRQRRKHVALRKVEADYSTIEDLAFLLGLAVQ
jgi:hypothetical protein